MVIQNVIENNGQKCDYQLILMDCNMPIMDGYDATTKIRQYIYEQGLAQPIISAVTGHSEQSYVERAYDSGMNQVLSKPVEHEYLEFLLSKLEFPRCLKVE
mmetsp:Transcript_9107/g.15361  ORF Transcript_9107/g.15361 Transcript_9107/m.15361 type:complete len:101 (-) Transcript_9107:19-321(-)